MGADGNKEGEPIGPAVTMCVPLYGGGTGSFTATLFLYARTEKPSVVPKTGSRRPRGLFPQSHPNPFEASPVAWDTFTARDDGTDGTHGNSRRPLGRAARTTRRKGMG